MSQAFLALLLAFGQDGDEDFSPSPAGAEGSYALSNGQAMSHRVAGTAQVKGTECVVFETTMAGQATREYLARTADGVKALTTLKPPGKRAEAPKPEAAEAGRARYESKDGKVLLYHPPAGRRRRGRCSARGPTPCPWTLRATTPPSSS